MLPKPGCARPFPLPLPPANALDSVETAKVELVRGGAAGIEDPRLGTVISSEPVLLATENLDEHPLSAASNRNPSDLGRAPPPRCLEPSRRTTFQQSRKTSNCVNSTATAVRFGDTEKGTTSLVNSQGYKRQGLRGSTRNVSYRTSNSNEKFVYSRVWRTSAVTSESTRSL